MISPTAPSPDSPLTPAGARLPGGAIRRRIIGLDLGGTKCAVAVLREGGRVEEVARVATGEFDATFRQLTDAVAALGSGPPTCFGISCGGPLDVRSGTILTPPNLPPTWHGAAIARLLTARFGGEAWLMNDANACALAEWRFGAGRGTRHMVFLTSGTGLGAGLVLNGELYEGATGDAGEIGHVRLRADGPVGYGKAGSAEGYYSGGGIARYAADLIGRKAGPPPKWYSPETPLTTKQIAEAAKRGDPLALEIMRRAGESLGEAIAILVDLFNPERVVIGGFFPACRELLEPGMNATLAAEALPIPRAACQIVPAALGATIGSYGAIAVALRGAKYEAAASPPIHD
jgi:glucokinase